jgi:cytochrome b involved in lipid metabolism
MVFYLFLIIRNIYVAILLFAFAIALVSFLRLSASLNNLDTTDLSSEDIPSSSGKITLDSLSEHNSLQDCWVAYDGKVYDITSFLPKHPGLVVTIIPFCGMIDDFKNAFEGKHETNQVANLMRVGTLMGDFDILGEI